MALLLLQQITSLLLIMACGFAMVKSGLLKSTDSRSLSVMSIYLIVPCVIIKSFQIELTEEVRNGFLLSVGAAVLIHIVLLVIAWACRRFLKLDAVEQCSAIYSNAGNLVIPLVTALLGDEWVIYSSAFICVQQAFLWTHAQARIGGGSLVDLKKLLLNMNIISIVVGIVLLLTGIRLPGILYSAVNSVSATIGPVCMIMIGMLLARVRFREILSDKKVYLVAFLRLIAIPMALLLALKVSGLAKLVPEGWTTFT